MEKKINVMFITNFLCRHQVGMYDELIKNEDINFTYLSTDAKDVYIAIGYRTTPRDYEVHSRDLSDEELRELVLNQDFVISGAIEDDRIRGLLKEFNKPIFYDGEHVFKEKTFGIKSYSPKNIYLRLKFLRHMQKIVKNLKKSDYVFCASAFAGKEYALGGFNKKHILRYGYFPPLDPISEDKLKEKDPFKILWSGRLLNWKHPEVAIEVLEYLHKFDNRYHLLILGGGEMLEELKEIREHSSCKNSIEIRGEVTSDEVHKEMATTSIYVFSSDYGEGWGAVLNEAMISGCVVFANAKAGSTNYLVKRYNGYRYRNEKELYKSIDSFLKNSETQTMEIRRNAIKMVRDQYSPLIVSERLYKMIKTLNKKEPFVPYLEGPFSLD